MLIVQENPTDTFVEIMQGASFKDASDVQHGWEVTELWTDEELASISVYRVQPATITDGRVPTGYTFARDSNGAIVQVLAYGDLVTDLKAYAANKRWQKEVGGVTFSGVPVPTDDRGQLKIAGARMAADADPNWNTVWEGADGGSYPINAAAMVAISNAVQEHVNGCFKTYATVKASIEAGTITTAAQIDAAFG